MNKFMRNTVGSWVTSLGGGILGLPQIWAGLAGLFDEDPATTWEWKLVISGIVTMIVFFAARDGNKSSKEVGAE